MTFESWIHRKHRSWPRFLPFFWAINYLQKGQKKGEKSWGGDVKKLFRLAVVRASCVAMLLKPTERRLRAEFTQSKHPHHKFSPFFYFFLEQNFKKVQEKGAKSWTGDDKKLFQLTVMIETSLAIFFQITERCFRAEFIASTHLHHDFYPFFWEIQRGLKLGQKRRKKGWNRALRTLIKLFQLTVVRLSFVLMFLQST